MEEHVENSNNNINNDPKRKLGKNILDNFTNLVNPQNNVRVKSSVNLLKYLVENKNEGKKHEEQYALGRLIKGLGSSTSNARAGFYSTLVILINLNESITIESIFSHILKHLHPAEENADIATGQVLTCGAIIRSRLWINSSNEDKTKVTELLLKASKEPTYLILVAYTFLIEGLQKIPKTEFQELFPLVKNEISVSKSDHNLDTLYLLYCLTTTCRHNLPKKFLINTIGSKEIVCTANIEYLSNTLMDIPRLTSLKHPVYEIASKDIASSELLSQILHIFDEKLEHPNRNKLLIVVRMLSIILQNVTNPTVIPDLLTINFIQQTINYFKTLKSKNQDPEFYQKTQYLFNTLSEVLRRENVASETKILVLKKLLFFPGTFIFEKITKSKLIQHITLDLDTDGVKQLATTVFTSVMKGTEKLNSQSDIWLNNDRLYAAHLLIKLLNHKSVKHENEWKVEQLCFIMDLGLFKGDVAVVGSELAASLKTAFFNALDLKLTNIQDLQTILIQLVRYVDSKISEENLETILRNPITPENYTLWQRTVLKITHIEQKNKKLSTLKTVFLTLFLHMALQLFNESKLATDSLNDLFLCFKNTKKERKNSSTSIESELDGDENKLSWIEVVTDLFLNWISHSSHLLRNIVKSVFPYLCEFMTATTIHQILSILDPKNKNVLSKPSEESSGDEGDNEDGKDEILESEDEDNDNSDIEPEDEPVNEKLRMALHKVLTNGTDNTDAESIDLDQLSDTEADKLDEELANVFKQFKPNLGNSKKQSRDEQTLMHFRLRALDLIEIYLENTPSMVLTLEIMLPLLHAVEYSIRDEHQKPLLDRLKSCVNKLSKVKFVNTDEMDAIALVELMKSLLDKGTKTAWIAQDMAVQIADCCIFTVKCAEILINSNETSKKVRKQLKNSISEILNEELQKFLQQRDYQTPFVLFKNIMQMNSDSTISMIPNLLKFVLAYNIKTHKKNQAADLLLLFYSNQRNLIRNPENIKQNLSIDHLEFSKNLLELIKRPSDDSEQENLKGTFICKMLKLLISMKNSCLKIDELDWLEIAKSIKEYRSRVTFSNDAKGYFRKLCNLVGLSCIIENKVSNNKVNSVNSKKCEEQPEEKKMKINYVKKDKSEKNEKLKLKKEAKMLRLQSLSSGLVENSFNSVNMDVTEKEVIEEDKGKSTKIKIKKKKVIENNCNNGHRKRKTEEPDHQMNKKKRK